MLTRNLMVALMAAGAAIASVLAFQRHARELERARQKLDLQRWEDDTGNVLPPSAESSPT